MTLKRKCDLDLDCLWVWWKHNETGRAHRFYTVKWKEQRIGVEQKSARAGVDLMA